MCSYNESRDYSCEGTVAPLNISNTGLGNLWKLLHLTLLYSYFEISLLRSILAASTISAFLSVALGPFPMRRSMTTLITKDKEASHTCRIIDLPEQFWLEGTDHFNMPCSGCSGDEFKT